MIPTTAAVPLRMNIDTVVHAFVIPSPFYASTNILIMSTISTGVVAVVIVLAAAIVVVVAAAVLV